MNEKKEYIERGAAVDELRRRTKMIGELIAMQCDSDLLKKVLNIYYNAREEAAKLIEEIPAADVAPVVHGEWDESRYPFCNVCPRCGLVIDRTCIKMNSGKLNYCSNCGAKMGGWKE